MLFKIVYTEYEGKLITQRVSQLFLHHIQCILQKKKNCIAIQGLEFSAQ